jgi:hypothetical protein
MLSTDEASNVLYGNSLKEKKKTNLYSTEQRVIKEAVLHQKIVSFE